MPCVKGKLQRLNEGKCFAAHARSFSSWDDYHKFCRELATSPGFVQVTVEKLYSNVGLAEQWYWSLETQKVWRLVEPDPPFKGLWEPVE